MTAPPSAVAAPTPEQIELANRLEGIFMPHARKQRDAIFEKEPGGPDPDPRFVHYTSAENALSIIKTKRLWMRNATCMSDYREVHHGFDILAKFFSDKPRLDGFTTALDRCAPGAAMEAINLFNGWWNNIRDDTYISSISEHKATEDFHGPSVDVARVWKHFRSGGFGLSNSVCLRRRDRFKFDVQSSRLSY